MSNNNEKEAVTGKRLTVLALGALGVVYGDIGTSPLYAIREIFSGAHGIAVTPSNILGCLSLFVWSLIFIVSIKYVTFMMRADNKGEGGIMALLALVLRESAGRVSQQKLVMVLGIFGAAMFYGDGVITPAISVLSAVEGLSVVTPAFTDFVIPLTMLILFALFLVQKHGTALVGKAFGPIMLIWFSVLAALGINNLFAAPEVLQALSPHYGISFLFHNKTVALVVMGSIVLAVTGAEALYADMGHFGKKPIQRAWFFLVLPALMLNYFGQGALLLQRPDAASNPFYLSAPDWALLPLVILATIATIVASQAVISGAFSVTKQAMQLGFIPRMEIQHTSADAQGQIYLPFINWAMMISVLLLVLGFRSSSNLAAAYGIAVTGDMVITSLLAIIVVARTWRWGWYRAVALFSFFLVIELSFLSANLLKIPEGGWFPLVAALVIFVLMSTWWQGRQLLDKRLQAERFELLPFLKSLHLSPPTRVPGTAAFLHADPNSVPHALLHNLMHNKILHERVVFVSVRFLDEPYIPEIHRVEVKPLEGDMWCVVVRFGFMDVPDLPRALEWCAEANLDIDMNTTSFFLGRETLIPRLSSEMPYWREKLFVALFKNAGSTISFFKIPSNRVVELGTQVVL